VDFRHIVDVKDSQKLELTQYSLIINIRLDFVSVISQFESHICANSKIESNIQKLIYSNHIMSHQVDDFNFVMVNCQEINPEDNEESFILITRELDFNRNHVMLFNLQDYFEQTWKSHNRDPNRVSKQFLTDFDRIRISINDQIVKTKLDFLDQMSVFWFQKNAIFTDIFTYMLILMITNQASFGYVYEFLAKTYNNPAKDQFVRHQRSPDHTTVKFHYSHNHNIECCFETRLDLFDFNREETIYNIDTKLVFGIQTHKDGYIQKKSQSSNGMLSWSLSEKINR
jgi:hypothetical protein